MNEKIRQILKYVLTALLAVFFIWLAVRKIEWNEFWQGLTQTRWGYIVLFILASIVALVFRALRWQKLLHPLEPDTRVIQTWDATNVGNLANVALPGVGELLRCGMVTSPRATYDKVLGTVLMERIWDVLAIAVLFFVALALKWNEFGNFFMDTIITPASGRLSLWWIAVILLAVGAAAVWAVFHWRHRNRFCGKIAQAVKGMLEGVGTFFKMEHKLRFALYTAGLWLMYVLMSYFGLKAIPVLSHLGFIDALFISAVGNIASVIPVPSGMGPYHYLIMVTLGSLYGCTSEIGLLYAVLCHETHAILIIVLGVISYIYRGVRKKN